MQASMSGKTGLLGWSAPIRPWLASIWQPIQKSGMIYSRIDIQNQIRLGSDLAPFKPPVTQTNSPMSTNWGTLLADLMGANLSQYEFWPILLWEQIHHKQQWANIWYELFLTSYNNPSTCRQQGHFLSENPGSPDSREWLVEGLISTMKYLN